MCWQEEDLAKNLNFFSISSDGRVTLWTMSKNELQVLFPHPLPRPPPTNARPPPALAASPPLPAATAAHENAARLILWLSMTAGWRPFWRLNHPATSNPPSLIKSRIIFWIGHSARTPPTPHSPTLFPEGRRWQ